MRTRTTPVRETSPTPDKRHKSPFIVAASPSTGRDSTSPPKSPRPAGASPWRSPALNSGGSWSRRPTPTPANPTRGVVAIIAVIAGVGLRASEQCGLSVGAVVRDDQLRLRVHGTAASGRARSAAKSRPWMWRGAGKRQLAQALKPYASSWALT